MTPIINATDVHFSRLHDYFGLWSIEPAYMRQMAANVAQMDLQQHVAQSLNQPQRQAKSADVLTSTTGVNLAVVQLAGTLMKHASSVDGSTSTIDSRKQIREAANDPSIDGVLLHIDSPGGTVAGTAELARDVYETNGKKPVWAFVDDLAASAAYWVASQAQHIVANHGTASIGSIGTYINLIDSSKYFEAEGLESVVIATGPLKGMGTDGTPITAEHKAYLKSIVDQSQAYFTEAVAEGRQMSLEDVNALATGGVFLAAEAVKNRLIDEIKSFDETLESFAKLITSLR